MKTKEKEEYIQVCPKCGSPDLDFGFHSAAGASVGLSSIKCNNCGHIGRIFPKIPASKVKKPKKTKKVKGRELVSTYYGSGLTSVWKGTSIIVFIFSVIMLLIPGIRIFGLFLLPFSVLAFLYSILKDKYSDKWFLKLIMIIIILYFISFIILLFYLKSKIS